MVYFNMELVGDTNREDWENYAYNCGRMAHHNRGIITVSALIAKRDGIIYNESVAEITGFSQEEFIQYMAKLKSHSGLKKVVSGIAGFDISQPNTYIVYCTKTPVDKFPFPKRSSLYCENLTLKEFNIAYDNLLMCMRSVVFEGEVYNNRGIFRNPKSFVDGGYPNLSIQLHAYSAIMMKEKFGKKYMSVSALPKMASILTQELKEGDYHQGKDISPEYKKSFLGFGALDIPLLIKIDSLSSLFKIAQEDINHKT